MRNRARGIAVWMTAGVLALTAGQGVAAGSAAHWRVGIAAGGMDFETDEALREGALYILTLGYAVSPRWTLEGVLEGAPDLSSSYRHDWETGERISRLSERAGRDLTDTSAIRLAVDGLLHLAPGCRLDPYLAVGAGMVAYRHDVGRQYEPLARFGAGVFVHLTDRWALRMDTRGVLAGEDTEFNLLVSAGLVFRASPSRAAARSMGPAPAVGAPPDVRRFVLYPNFDPGQSEIKPEYRSELNLIGRLMEDQSKSTARIEGHEPAGDPVEESAAQALSERRAEAVETYLRDRWGIGDDRLESAGYGTSRPDPDAMPDRARVTVWVTVP